MGGMAVGTLARAHPGPDDQHRIPTAIRALLISMAGFSWLAGGIATFVGTNQGGSVALIVGGVAAGLLGILGRWPSRVAISGHEVQWGAVRTAIADHLGAIDNDESSTDAAAELTLLLERLRTLQSTGSLPEHPAATYDQQVVAAIKRIRSRAQIFIPLSRNRKTPDIVLLLSNGIINIETKWLADPEHQYSGSTLADLIEALPTYDCLLVITNAIDAHIARRRVTGQLGNRAEIVTWNSPSDDDSLTVAIDRLASLHRVDINQDTRTAQS